MSKDLGQRFGENPILKPQDLRPSVEGMEVTCLLNPGVFRYQGKTWLLVRVAERPVQVPGKTSFPILSPDGRLEVLEFDSTDPRLDLSDPRVIHFDGQDYLTTLSHLRLLASDDGIHFAEPGRAEPLMGAGELETYGIEDCRVAKIGEIYYLTYTQVSRHGVGVGLRTTRDWKNFVHEGMIFRSAQQGLRALRGAHRWQILCAAPAQQPGAGRQLHLAGRVARPRSLGPAPLSGA